MGCERLASVHVLVCAAGRCDPIERYERNRLVGAKVRAEHGLYYTHVGLARTVLQNEIPAIECNSRERIHHSPAPYAAWSSFAHRDLTMAFGWLNDNRDIVTESRKNDVQARFRVAIDVAAQNSGNVRLTDAAPGAYRPTKDTTSICLRFFTSTTARMMFTKSNLILVSVGSE
jgi:hypothetical protein